MRTSNEQSRIWHGWGMLVTAGLCLLLFWPILSGKSEFGFRDSASLYQPLFEWTQQQWLSGQLPLWCPLDNWGAPVVADATSGVFYPGKLIFLFSIVPFSILFGIYLAAHVAWAVFGTRWCARQLDLSPPAQWLSAIAFGFGGSVIFQTCNVVFLVGASWLPWAVGCIWILQKPELQKPELQKPELQNQERSLNTNRQAAIGLMVSMAMMVLGGDPQIAFHTAIVATIWCLAGFGLAARSGSIGKSHFQSMAILSVIVAGAISLSAIQVFPSIEWASHSERVAQSDARTDAMELRTLVERPARGTHRDAIYQFSLPPWSIAEMVWPNVLGKLDFATNHRWSNSIAGADRVWTGSLYIGAMLFLLSICMMIAGRKQTIDYVLIGTMTPFLLASLGWYGLGWIVNELQLMRGGVGLAPLIGEPTGGLYWLLEVLIPGYDAFRYPAKLFVVAALPLCLLGGRGFDQLDTTESNRNFTNKLMTISVLVLFASVCAVAACIWSSLGDTARQINESAFHTCVVLTILGVLLLGSKQSVISHSAFQKALVALGIIDLVLATSWAVCPVEKPLASNKVVTTNEAWTVYRHPFADELLHSYPAGSLKSQLATDRETLFPKFHLLKNKRVIGSYHSVQPLDLSQLLLELQDLPADLRARLLKVLGVNAQVSASPESMKDWKERGRFYLTQHVDCLPPINERSTSQVADRTGEFVDRSAGWTSENQVLVECDPPVLLLTDREPTELPDVNLVTDKNNQIELQISIQRSHLLVIADYFDENWKAWRVENDGTRIELPSLRVNRVQRGYHLREGNFHVEMTYQPAWFYRGAVVSCLAWLLAMLMSGGLWIQGRRRQ